MGICKQATQKHNHCEQVRTLEGRGNENVSESTSKKQTSYKLERCINISHSPVISV